MIETSPMFLTEVQNPPEYRFEPVACYLCGADDARLFLIGEEDLTGKEGEFQYVRCHRCRLVYQHPRIAVDQIKSFYDDEYIAHRKKTDWGPLTPLYEWVMAKHDRDKAKLVERYVDLSPESQVLDVGCAVGTFLLHLQERHRCAISGVDFKEDLSYPGFERIEFHPGLFYEQELAPGRFDLVTMWHFLEHCYDPNRSLEMAAKVLKDSGRLVVEVPRLDSVTAKLFGRKWPGVQAPQHTALYDKRCLIGLMEKNGFEVLEHLPYGAFPPYFYLFAGTYFRLFGKGMNLDRIIVPYFAGQFLLTPLLLFQKRLNLSMQTVVCRKRR